MKKATATAPHPSRALDPKSVNSRLYNQIDVMLTDLEQGEHITLKERIAALIAIAKIQVVFVALRKEKTDDDGERGSAVRKYAGAFKADEPRGRKAGARPATVPARAGDDAGEDDLESILDDDPDPDAA